MTRRYVVLTLLLAAAAATGCGSSSSKSSSTASSSASSSSASHPLKVGFIYIGAQNDGGWNQAADTGRQQLLQALGSKIQTTYKINVPTSPQAAGIAQSLVSDGVKLIFMDSGGYENYVFPIAQKNPGVQFEQLVSSKTGTNYGSFNMSVENSTYLLGMALAGASKNGQIGMVSSFPFPANIQEVNGFVMGARAVNPKATVHVAFIDSFFDPSKERQAASALISAGATALGTTQNDAAPGEVANQAGVPWAADSLANGESYGPKTYLNSYEYGWGPLYISVTNDILHHQPVPPTVWLTPQQNGSFLTGWGPAYTKLVPPPVRAKISAVEQKMRAGSFEAFTGPMKDQSGKLRVPAGQQMTPSQINSMTWGVQGLIGKLS